MRHLRVVESPPASAAPAAAEPFGVTAGGQLRLILSGVPDIDEAPEPEQLIPAVEPITIDAHLQRSFAQIDMLFDGLEGASRLDVMRTYYTDGDGQPRARSLNTLRLA